VAPPRPLAASTVYLYAVARLTGVRYSVGYRILLSLPVAHRLDDVPAPTPRPVPIGVPTRLADRSDRQRASDSTRPTSRSRR